MEAPHPFCRVGNLAVSWCRQSPLGLEPRGIRQAFCPPVSCAGETSCTATATLHIYSVGARVALTQVGALLGFRLVQRPRGLHTESVQKSPFTLIFCLSGFLLR